MRKLILVLVVSLFAAACSNASESLTSITPDSTTTPDTTTTTILRTGGALNMDFTGYQGDYDVTTTTADLKHLAGWLGCYFYGIPMYGSVYLADYSSQADFSVYINVFSSSSSDLVVHVTDYSSQATSCGQWHLADYSSQADFSVYITNYSSQADFSVYITNSSGQAGR